MFDVNGDGDLDEREFETTLLMMGTPRGDIRAQWEGLQQEADLSLTLTLTPFQPHFNPISTPFQPHFNPILTPFQPHFNPTGS